MTSSVNKNSSIYSEPYIYGDTSESYKPAQSIPIQVVVNESLHYHSHVDRLFQKTTTSPIYVEPPSMPPEIENRLLLSDLIRPYENLVCCWESYLKKLEDVPQDSSTQTIRNMCKRLAELSEISRDILNKKHEFQKG